jgi:hypothetical protein
LDPAGLGDLQDAASADAVQLRDLGGCQWQWARLCGHEQRLPDREGFVKGIPIETAMMLESGHFAAYETLPFEGVM